MSEALTEFRAKRNACLRECQPWVERMAHLVALYGAHPSNPATFVLPSGETAVMGSQWPKAALDLYAGYERMICTIQRTHFPQP